MVYSNAHEMLLTSFFEKFPMLQTPKDSHIDLLDLMPCWLTHEWRLHDDC